MKIIKKTCDCGVLNSIDLDALRGQPLKSDDGQTVKHKTVTLDDNPVLVQCESCRAPIPVVAADAE